MRRTIVSSPRGPGLQKVVTPDLADEEIPAGKRSRGKSGSSSVEADGAERGSSELSVRAVDRAIAILTVLSERATASLAEIARAVDLSEATTLRYLNTMRQHRWVVADEQRRYQLGIPVFQMGQRAVGRLGIRSIALPHMEALLERFEETVNLAVRNGDDLIVIEVREGTRAIKRGASLGERDVWHASGLGKAILSWLPDDEAFSILNTVGTPRLTQRTMTTQSALREEFARIREAGYATDHEESDDNLRCVAAPIFDQHDRPVYALSVSGLSTRLSGDVFSELCEQVAAAARSISSALGHQSDVSYGSANTERAPRQGTAAPRKPPPTAGR